MASRAPKRITLWKGYHSPSFERAFAKTWEGDDELLIVCPPVLRDFAFLACLPAAEVIFGGEWEEPPEISGLIAEMSVGGAAFPAVPVLGVFTTGTTRDLPKLILYTRENIISCQAAIFDLFDRDRIQTVFSYPQPYYVFGLTLGYAAAHINHWRFIAPEGKYTAAHHQRWFDQTDPRLLTLATPAHISDLVGWCVERSLTPRPTYTCILGGARVERDVWFAARDQLSIAAPSIGYGCAEAAPGITHLAPGVEPVTGGEIGRILSHLSVDILPEGVIRFSGPSLCLATIENGGLHFPTEMIVHDRVVVQEDGSLVFAARADMILNRGGEKFSLEHLEATLREELGVQAICVALPDRRLGQELGLVIARAPMNRELGVVHREDVLSALERSYGRRFEQARYYEVERLPLNDNSKPDRKLALTLALSAPLP